MIKTAQDPPQSLGVKSVLRPTERVPSAPEQRPQLPVPAILSLPLRGAPAFTVRRSWAFSVLFGGTCHSLMAMGGIWRYTQLNNRKLLVQGYFYCNSIILLTIENLKIVAKDEKIKTHFAPSRHVKHTFLPADVCSSVWLHFTQHCAVLPRCLRHRICRMARGTQDMG